MKRANVNGPSRSISSCSSAASAWRPVAPGGGGGRRGPASPISGRPARAGPGGPSLAGRPVTLRSVDLVAAALAGGDGLALGPCRGARVAPLGGGSHDRGVAVAEEQCAAPRIG